MARNRMSAVYEYFTETEKVFTCKVEKEGRLCGMEITQMKSGGGSSGNLKRHLFCVICKSF